MMLEIEQPLKYDDNEGSKIVKETKDFVVTLENILVKLESINGKLDTLVERNIKKKNTKK